MGQLYGLRIAILRGGWRGSAQRLAHLQHVGTRCATATEKRSKRQRSDCGTACMCVRALLSVQIARQQISA